MRPSRDLLAALLVATLARGVTACGDAASTQPSSGGGEGGGGGSGGRLSLGDGEAPRPDAEPAPDAVAFLDALQPDANFDAAADANEAGPTDAVADAPLDLGDLGDECESLADCDDSFFCNGPERCERGVCFPAARVPCTDEVACTENLCNEETNECVTRTDDTQCADGQVCDPKVGCFLSIGCVVDAECDDALPCNGAERCVDRQCRPGEPVLCDDAVDCTRDACDDAEGTCRAVPDHQVCLPGELCNLRDGCEPRPPCQANDDCDDAIFCNGQETCDVPTGECRGGSPPEVDDEVPCTADACNEAAGATTHLPSNARCSNGLFCDGFEVCHPVEGCQPGEPPATADGVACTAGQCDETADFVVQVADDTMCDNGLFCDGVEVCDAVAGCLPGEPPAVGDAVGCTLDACNEVERRVIHVPDDSACDDGVFCNGADVCDPARGCVVGAPVVVDDGLDCTEDACVEGRREVRHTPVDALCNDNLFCNGDEVCVPDVGCQGGPAPSLTDGVDCTDDTCDEARETIVHVPVDARCDNALACDGVESCDAARGCLPAPDSISDDGIDCTVDLCDAVTGAVTHIPDDARCSNSLFCDGVETCDVGRGCQAGVSPALTDGVDCTDDLCNEARDTIDHLPVAAECDNGRFCDGAETCDAVRGCLPGAPPALTDGVDCTADACDEAGDRIEHIPVDGLCDDDRFCSGVESCDAVRGCQNGAPPRVDDGVACTTDACNEAADRVDHAPVNGRCDNALFCDGAETCDAARGCVNGAAPVIDDGIACTTDTCNEANDRVDHAAVNARCDNTQFCDGAETCDAARGCVNGASPALDDGVACTTDACNEATDRIDHTAVNARCDNALFCDGAETCDAQLGCRAGAAPALTDNVACTTDACDEANDRIIHTADNARCTDNRFCNGAETCHVVNGCQAGAAPVINDNIPCTTDACDEANDRVNHTPVNATCNDALFCNGVETCDAALGCRAGTPPVLTDNVACTNDVCNEAADRVDHTADNTRCTDNLFCNGAETCHAVNGCQAGVAPVLTDNVACTNDVCNEAADRVDHTPVNARCDDALFCNGAETCDAVLNCRAGVAPVLTDNVACTVDACDEANDRVIHTADNTRCTDNLFCNGAETCHAVNNCQAGVPPILDDGVACTVDSCDEPTDQVRHTANNARCDNANLCDGAETCNAVAGCQAGVRAADGTVCIANPRNICLTGACAATRCGDRYVDAVPGETCDDGNGNVGDGCDAACHTEGGVVPNYNGRFGVVPSLVYACQDIFFGDDVVNYNASELVFSVAGNILSVSGLSVVMQQNPRPADGNFSVTGVIAGGCTETYTLAGSFSDNDRWCGVFTLTFSGAQCGLSNCANQSVNVCGTRR